MRPENQEEWLNWPPVKVDMTLLRYHYEDDPVVMAILDTAELAWAWAIQLNGTVEELRGMLERTQGELKIQQATVAELRDQIAGVIGKP
jgi:hypothetical protein